MTARADTIYLRNANGEETALADQAPAAVVGAKAVGGITLCGRSDSTKQRPYLGLPSPGLHSPFASTL